MASDSHRRDFLRTLAASAAASPFLNLNPRAMGANERVNVALIGGRNEGRSVALRLIEAGCAHWDILRHRSGDARQDLTGTGKAQGSRPKQERDFRRVLDDKSIDAI